MTHLVIWIGPLCTSFLEMFYPVQSACRWLAKEAKKRVRQDADEAAWANSENWSEAVDLLELLMCFVPSLCKMSFKRSCWLQISLHIDYFNIFYDWLPATNRTLIYAPESSSQTLADMGSNKNMEQKKDYFRNHAWHKHPVLEQPGWLMESKADFCGSIKMATF